MAVLQVGDIAPGTPVPPFMGAGGGGGGATQMYGGGAPFNGGGFAAMGGGAQWNNSFSQPAQVNMFFSCFLSVTSRTI